MFEARASRRPCTATVGWKRPKPPRSTVLLSPPSRQAKPTRGLKLFLSVLMRVSGKPMSEAICGPAKVDDAGWQQGRDGLIRDDVVTAVRRAGSCPRMSALLVPGALELVAQAQEDREVPADLPVVLDEHREVVGVPVECRRGRRRAAAGPRWEAQEEVAEGVAREAAAVELCTLPPPLTPRPRPSMAELRVQRAPPSGSARP